MEGAPPPRTGSASAPPVDPDDGPATSGDVRALRRWLVVGLAWAVAASAIAIIALVDANDSSSAGREASRGVSAELRRVQAQLGNRIDALERRVGGLPTSADVSKLQRRLGKVEDDARHAASHAKDADRRLSGLAQRVKSLEKAPRSSGTSTTPTKKP
jgi:TolA-binding protein